MFQEEPEMDEAQFQQHCGAVTPEDIDPLAEKIEALAFPLPPVTQKLTPSPCRAATTSPNRKTSQSASG